MFERKLSCASPALLELRVTSGEHYTISCVSVEMICTLLWNHQNVVILS